MGRGSTRPESAAPTLRLEILGSKCGEKPWEHLGGSRRSGGEKPWVHVSLLLGGSRRACGEKQWEHMSFLAMEVGRMSTSIYEHQLKTIALYTIYAHRWNRTQWNRTQWNRTPFV